jgi:hypothetical protein
VITTTEQDLGLLKYEADGQYRGKGTPRRKVKKVHKSSGTDDKKLQTALKKLNVQPIQAIEEVNMFKSDGNVIHFSAPKGTFLSASHYHESWVHDYTHGVTPIYSADT